MRVLLVDDEPLALIHLKKLLGEIDGIIIAGEYDHPYLALEAARIEQPDVVFLDIDMPEITGIELAERIQNICREITIVFVTAYDQYAVKAFELNAIDYVMKPIQRKRLAETVDRLSKRVTVKKEPSPTQSGVVCCFQSLQFKRSFEDSKALDVHWRTSKAREMFAFLLQHRGKPVRKDVLLDLLWPEFDEKKGYAQLYAAIYQIRKTLEANKINITISNYDNSYTLELNDVKVDIDEWERGMSEFLSESNELNQHVLKLYKGDYFSEEGYLWAENERERLRVLCIHFVNRMTETLISNGKYTEAIIVYTYAQNLHPYIEDHYFMLMKLYGQIGDRLAVEQQYQQLIEMLKREYGIGPKESIHLWYRSWKLEEGKLKEEELI